MQKITHLELLSLVHFDPDTGVFTRKRDGYVIGKPDRKGYLLGYIKHWHFRLHRIAWFYMTGIWPSKEIDHINGITSDNRWENLRECDHSQNNHNQGMRRTNTSGVKGVYWSRKQNKWRGQVCLNYRIHHTPAFQHIEDAAAAVRLLREELHGEFANHG